MLIIKKTRRAIMLSTVLCSALGWGMSSAMAQQGPGVSDTEIRLGTWVPLTGALASYGVPYRAGAQAYLKMINDKGGINGRKVVLTVEDNAYNPQRTVAAARKLISRDEVFAIAMPFGAVTAASFDYVLDESKVPMLNPYGSALDWFKPTKPDLFGVMTLYENQANTIGRWVVKDGHKKIAVLHTDMAGFVNVAVEVPKGVKAASPDIKVEMLPTKFGTTDYGPIALDLAKKNPDAVVLIMAQGEVIAACKELRQQGFKGAFYTYSPSVANSVLELGGAAMEGTKAIGLTVPVNADTPAIKEYRDALAKYAPEEKPDYVSLIAFGLTKITVEALRRIEGPVNRPALLKSVLSIQNYDSGIFPPVSYTPDRHLGVTSVQRVVAKNGQWVAIGTPVDTEKDW